MGSCLLTGAVAGDAMGTELHFGDRLKQARERAGLSQAALAKAVGVSRRQVLNWEAGDKDPRAGALAKLADALATSVDWLLTGEGRAPGQTAQPLTYHAGTVRPIAPDDLARLVARIAQVDARDVPLIEQMVARLGVPEIRDPIELREFLSSVEMRIVEGEALRIRVFGGEAPRPAESPLKVATRPSARAAGIRRVQAQPWAMADLYAAAGSVDDDVIWAPIDEPAQRIELAARDVGAVIVRGDSAREFVRDRQAVLIDLARGASPGDACVVAVRNGPDDDTRLYCKRKERRGLYRSINPDYPDVVPPRSAQVDDWPIVAVLALHHEADTAATQPEQPLDTSQSAGI
jgi:transcriptional regulator with XRE-family HTH domain